MVGKRLFRNALAIAVMLGAAVALPQTPADATIGQVYGPYYLFDLASGKCLDDPKSSASDNTTMIIYDCTGGLNQKWYNEPPVLNNDYWTFNASSRKCLTVLNNRLDNNAPVIQYTCNTGTNEQWIYEKTYFGDNIIQFITVAGKTFIIDGYYKIINVHSGLCLTVQYRHTTNNTPLLQYDCNSTGSNMWAQLELY